MVEVEVADKTFPSFEIVTNQGVEEMDINVKEMLPGLFGGKKKRRKTTVAEAREILQAEEEGRLIDPGQVAREAVERAQSSGIVFLDEIDKVAGRESGRGPDVSREGVQRDLLPIVEGHHGQHEVRLRQDRPRALHRRRRLPRLQALGPDPGAPGPLPDPRRARLADRGGLRPHPDRARERAAQAVPRAARRRGRRPVVLRGGHRRDRPRRRARSTARSRTSARGGSTRSSSGCSRRSPSRAPRTRASRSASRSPTCRARWRISSRTRTCRATCCEAGGRQSRRSSVSSWLSALGLRQEGRSAAAAAARAARRVGPRRRAGRRRRRPDVPFPDRLLTGAPLTDLATIEVYRVVGAAVRADRAAAAGAARDLRAARPARGPSCLPGAAERRAATNAPAWPRRRSTSEAKARGASSRWPRSPSALAGRSVVYRDPLSPLLDEGAGVRTARLRRRLGAPQRRAQPALQHRDARRPTSRPRRR